MKKKSLYIFQKRLIKYGITAYIWCDVLLLLKNYLQNVIAKGSFKESKHPSEEK